MYSKGKPEQPIWWRWATHDEDGFVNGIADNAPEDMKKAYHEDQKTKEQHKKQGVK